MNGAAVDRAMKQTHEAGFKYAAVPLPWTRDWIGHLGQYESEFSWWECCGLPCDGMCPDKCRCSWNLDKAHLNMDGNGNVLFCLLPYEHDDACGYAYEAEFTTA